MDFKIEDLKLDLGMTPFENMFLNMYVDKADGEALKFYLLVYKDIYNQGFVDRAKIQKQLGYDDSKYEDAVKYWIDMGAFRQKKDMAGKTYIEIVSFRQMVYGEKTETNPNEVKLDLAGKKAIMFENVEDIIDRALTPADMTRIHDTLEDYGQDPELVTEAFRQAKEGGNVDVKYVMGYLKTWRDRGIKNTADLKIQEERSKLVRKNSPRQYKKNNKPIESNDSYSSYAEEARKKRLQRLLEEDNHDSK